MFDELEKYNNNDHFFIDERVSLNEACNAPKNKSGVYYVLELSQGKINLVYIGSSGKMMNNGKIKHRQGGLYDRLVNGKQFGKPRRQSWLGKIQEEGIDALDIYWYDTFSDGDIPAFVEGLIIQTYFDMYGCLPKWNKEF
ncbi:MAG: hypothetical protein HN601_09415 [Candidatus Marinimicrobia bacterium]|jgi:hypothetical protein|nr:hypothetical protein [Candidatus Neomarinimicrobiota bacterium]